MHLSGGVIPSDGALSLSATTVALIEFAYSHTITTGPTIRERDVQRDDPTKRRVPLCSGVFRGTSSMGDSVVTGESPESGAAEASGAVFSPA